MSERKKPIKQSSKEKLIVDIKVEQSIYISTLLYWASFIFMVWVPLLFSLMDKILSV